MSDSELPSNPETLDVDPSSESTSPGSESKQDSVASSSASTRPKTQPWKIWTPIAVLVPAVGMLVMPAFFVATPEAPQEIASAPKAIVVDLHRQWLYAYENGELVKHMPAVTGKRDKPTPPGKHAIGWKSEDYTSREYNAPMPHAMFFVVKRGIAIHGSTAIPWRWRANRFGANMGSAGCVSLTPANAKELFDWAPPKTPVFVTMSLDPSIMPQSSPVKDDSEVKK